MLVGTHPTTAAAADNPVPLPAWRQQIIEKVRSEDYEQAMRLFYSGAFSEPGSRNLIEVFMHLMRQQPPEIIRDFFTRPDPDVELRPLLPTLRVPTLVVHGEEDQLVPVMAGRYLTDHIPDAQFYLFRGRGHIPMFTATTEFAQVIRNFIRTGRPIDKSMGIDQQ